MYNADNSERNYSAYFITAFFAAFMIDIISRITVAFEHIYSPATIMYCLIIIAWMVAAANRIVHKPIRQHLVAIGAFLLMLFIVRICRYSIFMRSSLADKWLWYLFYVPFIVLPMLSLSAASWSGKSENYKIPTIIKACWSITGLIMAGMLTNDLHHAALSFTVKADGSLQAGHNWLYYVIFAWSIIITLSSYILLIKRCRLSQCRKNWYVPVIPSAAAFVLIIIYYAVGGAPIVAGVKLYNIQEVYLLLFIGLWEGSIRIGLITSNTGYNKLFERTHINAEIKSADGKTVYRSSDWSDTEGDPDYSRKTYAIRGGSVTWSEDISVLNRINSDIEDVTEQVEEENVLIEEENRLYAEKARYETRNRLYDRIAEHTHPQLVKIDDILHGDSETELRMKLCMLFGTYVKRCSNLMLIAADNRTASSKELHLAISESIDCLKALGVDCELVNSGPRNIPSVMLVDAYDVFEAAVETALDNASAFSVNILPSENVLLTVETDSVMKFSENIGHELHGTKLDVFTEDEIQHIVLSMGGEVNAQLRSSC